MGLALPKTKAGAKQGQSTTKALEMHSQALPREPGAEFRLVRPETNPPAVPSLSQMDNLCRENEEESLWVNYLSQIIRPALPDRAAFCV